MWVSEPVGRIMGSHCWLLGNGQELHEYAREGPTKKTAMEMAAGAIATSGHCVCSSLYAANDPSLIYWLFPVIISKPDY